MPPLIGREEALRLGELEDHAEIGAPAGLRVRLWDPSRQLRKRPKRFVPPRPDGAPNTGRDLVT